LEGWKKNNTKGKNAKPKESTLVIGKKKTNFSERGPADEWKKRTHWEDKKGRA